MKKIPISLMFFFFVACLVFVGCSRPKWVNLGPSADGTSKYSVNVESITKIQTESVDRSVLTNDSTPIKRELYAAWTKIVPGDKPEEKQWVNPHNGKKIAYFMTRDLYDLANREIKKIDAIAYYETGEIENAHEYLNGERFRGVVPNTMDETAFEVIEKYHP